MKGMENPRFHFRPVVHCHGLSPNCLALNSGIVEQLSSIVPILGILQPRCESRSFLPERTLQLAASCDQSHVDQSGTRRR